MWIMPVQGLAEDAEGKRWSALVFAKRKLMVVAFAACSPTRQVTSHQAMTRGSSEYHAHTGSCREC